MVVLVPPPPMLSPDAINVYYVIDHLLARSPILIFYGPSATPTAALNNSRIQAHIFSPAGFHSYPRLTVAPSSQLYAAVNNLPREEQGDEICRGLAFSLYKYFTEIQQPVKDAWAKLPSAVGRLPAAPILYSDAHAAMLASKMTKVQNNAEIIKDVRRALAAQSTSWLDMDLILPVGTMRKINANTRDSILPDPSEADLLKARYGQYAPLIELFGESSFLPTSRMKRAPSKATAINSSSAFSRIQKEAIRQEMNELLDTEESFVSKLNDLVYKVAADFRQKAKRKEPSSQSPDAEVLKKLFPSSLDDILVVNSAFLDALRQVVENSENDAIADIERTPDEGTALPSVPTRSDPTGSLALAMILRSWFPKFAECYGDYVKAHSHFSTHLRKFTSVTGSSFSKRLQETGEQKLMSMLIEPVQRLPRYQLYIDSIVKQLPSRHPALKSLLKARDSITQICAETVSNTSPSQVIEQLRGAVASWPTSLKVQGRLVTAVDVVEIPPPYSQDATSSRAAKGIMLLFTDLLVLLRKTRPDALSARGLMAQLDGIDAASETSSLEFRQALALPTFNMTEMHEGRFLQVMPVNVQSRSLDAERRPGSSRPGSGHGENLVQVLQLQGSYDGKAGRFMEELAKARVEGRFSEKERESHAWEVRYAPGPDLNLLIAVQEGADQSRVPDRGLPARIRVSLHGKGSSGDVADQVNGVDVSASVRHTEDGLIQLRVNGNNGTSSVDGLTPVEFLPVFTKRVSNALQYQSQIRNLDLTTTLLLRNQHILQSLSITTPADKPVHAQEERLAVPNTGSMSQRPNSPVKLLTNLFGGGSISRENSSLRRPNVSATKLLADAPRLAPASAPNSRPVSKDSNVSQISLVPSHASSLVESRLEETFSSYILSLEARKGNMVGKVIRSRAMADELLVSEVYNSLLQDPANCEIAAQAPVDVLFAAFEKFMKIAWTNGFGPLISNHVQETLQNYLHSSADIGNNIQNVLFEMDSPSRSAFKAIVRLLSGLLQESANDGDKGVLTAAFAEAIAPEGEAVQIITVLDRLVEDTSLLQSSPIESIQATPAGSMNSRHGNLNHAPVIGGHSSSLRKKFGFGSLTRKAKSQMEDTVESASVWRTLSKSKQGAVANQPQPVPPPSALMRSRSTDIDLRSTKRPNSREKPPPTLGPMDFEEKSQFQLSTIGEHPLTSPPPRKKRRSSISDLRSLNASANSSPAPRPLTEVFSPRQVDQENNRQGSPRTPSRKPSLIPAPSPLSSRLQTGSLRGASPYKQENSPSRIIPRPLSIAKTTPSPSKVNEVTISTHKSNSRRTETISGRAVTPSSISTPRPATAGGGLSERPMSGNIRRLPRAPTLQENVKPAPSVQKLRMQSPKKLRERLAAEQKAIDDADSTLQAEIARIGEQIADSRPRSSDDTSDISITGAVKPVVNTRMRSALSPSPATALSSSQPTPLDLPTVAKHLSNLSQSHSTLLSHLRTRLDGLSNDISSSLMVSESRAQRLDVLYRDANAENEALYAKFNEELQRMIGKVKLGGMEAEKEVLRRAKAAEEESESLRRENARLKREVVGLRAQLRE